MSKQHPHLNVTPTDTLPSPHELLQDMPTTPKQQQFIKESRTEIQKILDGVDPRFLLIVGPCSIHDILAAKEFAAKLRQLSDDVEDVFHVIMRVYFEKPRTTIGWKGFLYDPKLDGSHDIASGVRLTRNLLLHLADMEVAAASEFLDPAASYYFGDLISWGCIGARTAASQTHRQMASGLPMPVAFKNSTDGNIDIAINGITNASHPHKFIGINSKGHMSVCESKGNLYGHIVLRGGEQKPNYDSVSIAYALERLRHSRLPQRLLVDCSHDNSLRDAEQQVDVFQSIIYQIVEGNHHIRGLLLESNLFAGNQPFSTDPSKLQYAISLTDPCLGWADTEELIRWGYHFLKRDHSWTTKSANNTLSIKKC